ncbi:MAG TPA: hypothetical protein IAC37_07475 [Candidatus Ventrimonas merdavium]|nr:hypothetical protein [Candidatus Ventrimonas merdavium]
MEECEKNLSSTPYDDVFRTLLTDCSSLIIPVINEAFGEHYSEDEAVEPEPNEHFLNRQDGEQEERVTDSCFWILKKRYHVECQSTLDNTMIVRMFEYDSQIALTHHQLEDQVLTVRFPESAVMYLRHSSRTADEMQIRILTRGGEVSYGIPVMKVQNYSLDEIFEKRLLFLLPFYLFRYERQFGEMNGSEQKLVLLKNDYERIRQHLIGLEEAGQLTSYSKVLIVDMIYKVMENLAVRYPTVQKGVKAVMGGKVLDHEAKRIKQSGVEEGRKEGRIEGRKEGRMEGRIEGRAEGRAEGSLDTLVTSMRNLMKNLSVSADEAMKLLGVAESMKPKLKTML